MIRRLAPSVLNADLAQLADQVRLVEEAADWIHLDLMDGHFVPNLTLGPPVVAALRPHTSRYLDCHLMVDDPEALLPALAEAGASGVSMHVEALDDPARALAAAAEHGLDAGLAVKPGTPLDTVLPYLDSLDLVLAMTVEPGFGGQAFDDQVLPKITAASPGHRRGQAADRAPGRRRRQRGDAATVPAGGRRRVRGRHRHLRRRRPGRRGQGVPGTDRRGGTVRVDEMVLIADDDRDIVRFVEVNLRLEGFEVITAHDGQDALTKALDQQPNLILLDVMMPRMDGYEVCTKLRADGRSAHIPVIMLTAKSLSADKVLGLTAGADDYIIKPFDPMELVARVKTTLRRASEMRSLSPLTGLPGNLRIEQEIAHRMDRGKAVAVAYADLDNFKSYNDRYGFLRGDEVISLFAQVLRRAAQDAAGPDGFVGHIGGDDFVALIPPEAAETFASRVITGFDDRVPTLYDPEDASAGSVELEDRQGQLRRFPIVSVSLGIASSAQRVFSNHRELVATATELKHVAKRQQGSSYAMDRRTDGF